MAQVAAAGCPGVIGDVHDDDPGIPVAIGGQLGSRDLSVQGKARTARSICSGTFQTPSDRLPPICVWHRPMNRAQE